MDKRAAAITGAALWGALCLLVGIAHFVWPPYGEAFLQVLDSLYFGLVGDATVSSLVALGVLTTIDGAVLGYLIAWLYERLART